ncbi:MAG TPA: hypothetical protein VI978_01375 [Candidatus Paceibacterota bacterium]
MRYKVVSLAIAILLIATPAYSQEKSYIVVETPRTAEPTTVITGQPLIQTYIIRFIDLTDSGEKIIVLEEALNLKALGEFEVLSLSVEKQTKQREFLEHIWHVRYVLRIVSPKKGAYIIPPISVPWKHKKAGQEENDPTIQLNYDFKTDEVNINYVTTIPEKESSLEIREQIDFGNFDAHVWLWKAASWFLFVMPFVTLLTFFVRSKRSKNRNNEEGAGESSDHNQTRVSVKAKKLTKIKTWLDLRRRLKYLKNCQTEGSGQINECLKAEAEVVLAVRNFLMARVSGLSIGSTPLNIVEHITKNIKELSVAGGTLLQLAQKSVELQNDIERDGGKYSDVPSAKAEAVGTILADLRFYRVAGLFVRHKFDRIRKFISKKFRGGRR